MLKFKHCTDGSMSQELDGTFFFICFTLYLSVDDELFSRDEN